MRHGRYITFQMAEVAIPGVRLVLASEVDGDVVGDLPICKIAGDPLADVEDATNRLINRLKFRFAIEGALGTGCAASSDGNGQVGFTANDVMDDGGFTFELRCIDQSSKHVCGVTGIPRDGFTMLRGAIRRGELRTAQSCAATPPPAPVPASTGSLA